MAWNDAQRRADANLLASFANCTVTVQLGGVGVSSFRAIFDDSVEVVSPYQIDQTSFKPQMTALSTDISAISGSTSFDILRDNETESKIYSFDGKPRPDGSGLTLVYLAVKK